VLIAISFHEYRTYNLGWDFGQAEQAWYLVAHGYLNPFDTLNNHPWWQDHSEFASWLAAPLYWVYPNDGLTLLLLQDLAIVVGIAAGADWVLVFCRRRALSPSITAVCIATLLALCVCNTGFLATVFYDFHYQVIGAAFLILTGHDVYSGHSRRAVVWGVLTALTMDLSALNLFAMGLGFVLFDRQHRKAGAVMAVGGLAWYGFVGSVGGSKATDLATYSYLVGRPLSNGLGSSLAILSAIIEHPRTAFEQLKGYRYQLYDNLVPSGFIGLFEPLMVLPILVVILPDALNGFPGYIRIGFQNCPVYLLAALGSALVLARLASRRRVRNGLVIAVALVTVAVGLICDVTIGHNREEIEFRVSDQAASQLAAVRAVIPGDAEIASDFGVLGRFSGRRYVYLVAMFPQTLPVRAAQVVVIFAPYAGNQPLSLGGITHAESWLVGDLHARVLYDGSQVQAYEWTVGRSHLGRTITLP
jgi:uncharacterized membrane protein